MPLYDLLVLTKPALQSLRMHQLIKKSCNTVLSGDGVITKITNNGLTTLAYTIKKTQGQFDEAHIWQLRFHAAPPVLKHVNHDLATNEDVLRYQVTRSRDLPKIKQWRVNHHYARMADFDRLYKVGESQGGSRGGAQEEVPGSTQDHGSLDSRATQPEAT